MSVYSHILIAVDFSGGDDPVVTRAKDIADTSGARISLVHVVEPVALGLDHETFMPQDLDIDRKLVEVAGRQLDALMARHRLEQAGRFVEQGYTRREILRLAKEQAVDLIVVGSHGRSGVQLLLGSTANAVLHGAHCDVLAVRIQG